MTQKAVKIKWIDPTVISEWIDREDINQYEEMNELFSVGLLVKEDDKFLTIALSLDDSEGLKRYNCIKIIPKSCIRLRHDFEVF